MIFQNRYVHPTGEARTPRVCCNLVAIQAATESMGSTPRLAQPFLNWQWAAAIAALLMSFFMPRTMLAPWADTMNGLASWRLESSAGKPFKDERRAPTAKAASPK
eukprot:1304199-Alexandrium_andersonii.AAC.1